MVVVGCIRRSIGGARRGFVKIDRFLQLLGRGTVKVLLVVNPPKRIDERCGIGVSLHHRLRQSDGFIKVAFPIYRIIPGQIITCERVVLID